MCKGSGRTFGKLFLALLTQLTLPLCPFQPQRFSFPLLVMSQCWYQPPGIAWGGVFWGRRWEKWSFLAQHHNGDPSPTLLRFLFAVFVQPVLPQHSWWLRGRHAGGWHTPQPGLAASTWCWGSNQELGGTLGHSLGRESPPVSPVPLSVCPRTLYPSPKPQGAADGGSS